MLREKLKTEIQETEWSALRQHLVRDAIIKVHVQADLLEVAVAIASDDKACAEAWISSGKLSKPTKEELAAWETTMDRRFRFLIIAPFVLVQEIENFH